MTPEDGDNAEANAQRATCRENPACDISGCFPARGATIASNCQACGSEIHQVGDQWLRCDSPDFGGRRAMLFHIEFYNRITGHLEHNDMYESIETAFADAKGRVVVCTGTSKADAL